jgi:60S ribosome subunit biogenesis protein NIP7
MTLESTVYYMSDRLAKLAASIGRDELLHVGTCFGKFTKTKKFRLHITCLDYLAKYAKHKVWLKPGGEQSYLYGNHIIKTQVAKVSENIP